MKDQQRQLGFWVKIIATVAILAALAVQANVCPPTQTVEPPATVDPNQIHYKLMCVIETRGGQAVQQSITACDPDGDPLEYRLLQAPESMTLEPATDPNEISIRWTAVEGVYYVDLEVSDSPPNPQDTLTDRASIVLIVAPRNRPPIFGGCR